jgi:hypothetical protein
MARDEDKQTTPFGIFIGVPRCDNPIVQANQIFKLSLARDDKFEEAAIAMLFRDMQS